MRDTQSLVTVVNLAGKKDTLDNDPLCPQSLKVSRYADKSLTINEFKEKYLKDPASGIFFADDALLQYQSYREDRHFTPLICGEFGADYKPAHEELRRWYSQQFFAFLETKISAEATFNPVHEDPGYYAGLKEPFTDFLNSISTLVLTLGRNGGEGHSGSILLKYILKKTLVSLRKTYKSKEEVLAANPAYVDSAELTFDAGSGLYLMELFFLIRDSSVLYDFTQALKALNPVSATVALHSPQLMVIPWRHQSEALSRWLNVKQGIVEMATATGKTVVGLMAIEHLWHEKPDSSVLIMCHRSVILNQWRREIIQKLGLAVNENDDYKRAITVGRFSIRFETIQTVMKKPRNYRADLLIIDEVHHIAGEKFGRALDLPHRYRLGLTAQLDEGERKRAVTRYFGKIIYNYTLIEALKDSIIPEFSWIVHPVSLDVKEEEEFRGISSQIRQSFNYIKNDKSTIRKITGNDGFRITTISDFIYLTERARYSGVEIPESWLVLKTLLQKRRWIIHRSGPRLEKVREFAGKMADKHKIIIFLMDTESCDSLALELKKRHQNVFVIHSKIREDPIRVINDFRDVPYGILLGVEMLNEGIDIPNADVGINVAFTKTQLQLVQRMGRILRRGEGKKPKFFQFVAVPDRSAFVEEIDAPEFVDDLSWVQSTAIKMGLDLDIVLDSEELLRYKSDAENFIRNSYQTVTSNQQSFGTFNLKKTLEELDATAVRRIVKILPLYGNSEITDKQWEDTIRTAYSTIDDHGRFQKARFVDAGKSWYILIIANRSGNKIAEIFSKIEILDDPGHVPLPPLMLDENGLIVYMDGCFDCKGRTDSEGEKELPSPAPAFEIPLPDPHRNNVPPGIVPDASSDNGGTLLPSEDIFSRIINGKGGDKIDLFSDEDENPHGPDVSADHSAESPDIATVHAMISQGKYADLREFLQYNHVFAGSPEICLCNSLENMKNGNITEALLWMERTLKMSPDDDLVLCYKTLCEIAGKNPLDVTSIYGKGKRVRIPGLEGGPVSVKDAGKWINAYESGAFDAAVAFYREQMAEKEQEKSAAGCTLAQELNCLENIRSGIYLLKLFLAE